ncbi:hypothetical protein B484DRAFT_401968 [Ochromonadaceae sp. CCMP2298]|nr:hypothetical protein B484DRAFT_401968 [Ochromonadaceae sp. CCMP2298]
MSGHSEGARAPQVSQGSSHTEDTFQSPSGVVDISPNRRYVRSNDIISGTVDRPLCSYKAFDTNNGVEIAWHKLSLRSFDPVERKLLARNIEIVRNIEIENIIRYLDLWYSDGGETINIITTNAESLKEFVSKVKTLRWRIVKKWCRQFLSGLQGLHSHSPPIIHRRLALSHIYIDGGLGTTTLGDLWLSCIIEDGSQIGMYDESLQHFASVSHICTPPESFEGRPATPKTDVYCLGMLLLEMVTGEEPYRECGVSLAKLRSKVLACLPPLSLQRLTYHAAKDFIAECLLPETERPSVADLVLHEFLAASAEDDDEIQLAPDKVSEYIATRESAATDTAGGANGTGGTGAGTEIGASTGSGKGVGTDVGTDTGIGTGIGIGIGTGTSIGTSIGLSTITVTPAPAGAGMSSASVASAPVPSVPPLLSGVSGVSGVSVGSPAKARTPTVFQDVELMALSHTVLGPAHTQYQILMKIPRCMFREQEGADDKEVEFTFDSATDSFPVVSAEMAEELDLTVSVAALAQRLELFVQQSATVAIYCPVPIPAVSVPVSESGAPVGAAIILAAISPPAPDIPALADDHSFKSMSQISDLSNNSSAADLIQMGLSEADSSHSFSIPSDTKVMGISIDAAVADRQVFPQKTALVLVPGFIDQGARPILSLAESLACCCCDDDTSAVVGDQDATPGTPVPKSAPASSAPASASVFESVTAPASALASAPTSAPTSASTSVTGAGDTPPPWAPGPPGPVLGVETDGLRSASSSSGSVSMDLIDMAQGGLELQREVEKIDQEARVARRAFENRIQKLINIQETCKDDIVQLEVANQEKVSELGRKDDLARERMHSEMLRMEEDFEAKLKELREKKWAEHVQDLTSAAL